MSKSLVYIFGGIAVAAVAALVFVEIRRRNQAATATANLQYGNVGADTVVQKFRGFNFARLLNSSTKQATAEITALQHMINAYYNGTQFVPVNGVFDDATRDAVKNIVGKSSTTLKEFKFKYLAKERGAKVADDIIKSITITGK